MRHAAVLTFALLLTSAAPALALQFVPAPTNADGSARFTDPDSRAGLPGLSFHASGNVLDDDRQDRGRPGFEPQDGLNYGPNYPTPFRR